VLPGYLGGSLAYREELRGQGPIARRLGVTSLIGSLVGGVLLIASPAHVFSRVVPGLIVAACLLLAFQTRLARALGRHGQEHRPGAGLDAANLLVSVYGGYFGAGLGIMMLGAYGLLLGGELHRLNALKGLESLVVGVAAGVLFAALGPVAWGDAAVMAVASFAGGRLGVRLARLVPVRVLRAGIVAYGLVLAVRLAVA
jgi:uncharacterized membrane protein YfcA